MNILRDKRLTTKILILLELSTNQATKHKDLAGKFDMTVQAVSDYFKIMRKEGLVRKVGRSYKPTQKGILFLHSNFSEIREFIDEQINALNIIDLCTAVAGTNLRPGDRVGLFMEDGELRAYKGRSSTSMGMVVSEARKGDEVGVKELEGIVRHVLGDLWILKLPTIQEGGTKGLVPKQVKKAIEKASPDRIGVVGAIGRVMLRKLGIRPDIEFSVPISTLEACQRGLKVLVLAEDRGAHEIISKINDFNLTSEERIRYNLVSFPIKKGKRSGKGS